MNAISLCSGIGGIELGLKRAVPGYRTVCYVEIEAFPQDILLARMADGFLDQAPIWGDLKQFDGRPWRGLVDVVHGGYPCQPFSVAGKRQGVNDPRHLWPDIARVVRECEPEWCFFENVAGHLRLGFDVVARDLVDMGYRVAAGLFTAAEVGAPHRRQRLFVLARLVHARRAKWWPRHASGSEDNGGVARWPESAGRATEPSAGVADSEGTGQPRRLGTERTRRAESDGCSSGLGDADDARLEGRRESVGERADELLTWPPSPEERDQWARVLAVRPELAPALVADAANRRTRDSGGGCDARGPAEGNAAESAVRRVADGAPRRVDRLKALGNGVVPACVEHAWLTLQQQIQEV